MRANRGERSGVIFLFNCKWNEMRFNFVKMFTIFYDRVPSENFQLRISSWWISQAIKCISLPQNIFGGKKIPPPENHWKKPFFTQKLCLNGQSCLLSATKIHFRSLKNAWNAFSIWFVTNLLSILNFLWETVSSYSFAHKLNFPFYESLFKNGMFAVIARQNLNAITTLLSITIINSTLADRKSMPFI